MLNAPNAKKIAGDKRSYTLWKTALLSEAEHIHKMKSDMWLRLLAVRFQGYANQIVRENKAAQEILGPLARVEQI